MTNKKILNFIPNFSFGGVETTNINLSETLIKFGYEVDLVTNDYQRVNKSEYSNNVKSLKKSKMLYCLFPLIKYINNTKPDLIICSQFYANIIVLLACFISGYKNKIILCERVPVFENLKNISIIKKNVIRFLIKRLYKKADRIVCNSYGTKNDLNKITDVNNSVVIYNPVLGDSILNQSEITVKDLIFNKKTKYLITVSRIAEERNIIELIDIFNLLSNKKNIKLLIIGDGPLLDECKSKVKQLNLENKIHFLGYKSNPYKYLSKSHIYLSTAKWEGMGNSIIEALFFGLYVIAYDSPGGVSEILKDGKFGSLIPYGDKQKFASDLIKNLHNSNLKNQDINEHLKLFKPDNVTKKYIDLIEAIST
ncbi:MAG: hypothetical protein CMO13_01345 [Thaumarchaeota archaeon]|nr:hypothetical protein [Nitrososphaerota archaeon]|tara:strand:- start:42 stop:1139 length:1098 start_codon:yes stop_codon:yes gene_type:complete